MYGFICKMFSYVFQPFGQKTLKIALYKLIIPRAPNTKTKKVPLSPQGPRVFGGTLDLEGPFGSKGIYKQTH